MELYFPDVIAKSRGQKKKNNNNKKYPGDIKK